MSSSCDEEALDSKGALVSDYDTPTRLRSRAQSELRRGLAEAAERLAKGGHRSTEKTKLGVLAASVCRRSRRVQRTGPALRRGQEKFKPRCPQCLSVS